MSSQRRGDARSAEEASRGYESLAGEFVRLRSRAPLGAGVARVWARTLPPRGTVLELGCGHGVPITQALLDEGLQVLAVDASPTLLAAFRRRFPSVPTLLATAEALNPEELPLRGEAFDGVAAWGLLFLLDREAQEAVLAKAAAVLAPGGRLLFTAPAQVCAWRDSLTGRDSESLGRDAYVALADGLGLALEDEGDDEGGNHYYVFRRRQEPAS